MYISKPNTKLIFTDLDGTFLSTENFSYGDNIELVNKITNLGNIVIFNSSKTFIEIKNFLSQNNLKIPLKHLLYTPKTMIKMTTPSRKLWHTAEASLTVPTKDF